MEYGNQMITMLQVLSNLVVIAQAIDLSTRKKKSRIEEASDRLKKPFKVGGKSIDQVIDKETLRIMILNTEKSVKKLQNVLESELPQDQKELEIERAEKVICNELIRVRKLNKNVLPTKRLEKLWESHRCGKV